jgi:hypothetical protein
MVAIRIIYKSGVDISIVHDTFIVLISPVVDLPRPYSIEVIAAWRFNV